jgi:hypothetical protein
MGAFKNLLVDMTVDACFAYVIRAIVPTVVHRAIFDGEKAAAISICGVRERGGWRVLPGAYTQARHCKRCEAAMVRMTHGARRTPGQPGDVPQPDGPG